MMIIPTLILEAISRRIRNERKATSRANDLAPIIKSEMLAGQSLRAIAQTLDAKGIKTSRGSYWTAASVQRVIKRLEIN